MQPNCEINALVSFDQAAVLLCFNRSLKTISALYSPFSDFINQPIWISFEDLMVSTGMDKLKLGNVLSELMEEKSDELPLITLAFNTEVWMYLKIICMKSVVNNFFSLNWKLNNLHEALPVMRSFNRILNGSVSRTAANSSKELSQKVCA